MSELKVKAGTLEIPVQIAESRSAKWKPRATGVITSGDLYERYEVPRKDYRNNAGYQRELSTTRVNRLVKDLRDERVDLPTSILVNIRDFDADRNLRSENGQYYVRLGNEKLYIVDGQHRVGALAKLIEEDPDRWGSYEMTFVSMLGATEYEEMREFYVVNSNAKSVRTDLAFDLLKRQAESDPIVQEGIEASGQAWKVKGQTVAEELDRSSSLWRGIIRFPGSPKGSTIISSASVVSSLKPLFSNHFFDQITTQAQVKVLDAYWKGAQRVMQEPFDTPSDYTLQKGLGTMVMHGLLATILEHVRVQGRSVIEPQGYADLLEQVLPNLQGDSPTGEVVGGEEFWRTGSEGAVSSYSSSAGQRVLIAKLRTLLPPIEVI